MLLDGLSLVVNCEVIDLQHRGACIKIKSAELIYSYFLPSAKLPIFAGKLACKVTTLVSTAFVFNEAFLAPSQERATLSAHSKYYPKSLAGTSKAPSALQANEREIKMKGLQE